ncbi:MAG: hypothetical protein HQL46_04570 [Gammaproteobacteria bacterium]|nr:hypothetical protein [Gammaproteobacteria bacterium]
MIIKIIRIFIVLFILSIIAFFAYDYRNFSKIKNAEAKEQVNQALNDILKLNSSLRFQISHLLILNRDLFEELIQNPESEKLIEKFDAIFNNNLPSYYTFSLADENGDLLTDHFFEKVGRLCRQDIHEFAVDESTTWLTIHPGPDEYHYDLMLPWNKNSKKRVVFLGFKIDSLVEILKSRQPIGRKLYIVRSDKNNLVEVSANGSRDKMSNQLFLSDQIQYHISEPIEGTYWAIVDVIETPIYKLYYRERIAELLNSQH